jgi:hypothetical protein
VRSVIPGIQSQEVFTGITIVYCRSLSRLPTEHSGSAIRLVRKLVILMNRLLKLTISNLPINTVADGALIYLDHITTKMSPRRDCCD